MQTNSMKLRLLLMGVILSVLGAALMAARGVQAAYGGLVLVGLVLLVLGVLWKQREASAPAPA